MDENNETRCRGGDSRKAILCRWTLDRLYKHPDLMERLKREEYDLAWRALSGRSARTCLLRALEIHPEIQTADS
jgi:hypothetical protein